MWFARAVLGRLVGMTTSSKRPLRLAAALLFTSLALLTAAPVDAAMVLHRGNQAEPGTLDPQLSSLAWENAVIGDLFLGLTTEDVAGKPIAGAAESWTTSPDGLVWTFTLRPGVVWSDGTPVTAGDFVASIQRLLDPKTAAIYASVLYPIKNAEAANSEKVPLDDVGVHARDDRTVEITLETPTPYLLGLLTHQTAYPIPRHVLEKFGADWVKPGNMVSNGPYKLVEWKAHEHIKTVKNPLFYDAANVAIDEVIYYPTDDTNAALNRFRAGELDVNLGTRGFPASQIPWLMENMPGQARITPMLGSEYIVLNIRRAPFSDMRLRRAVSLCLDRGVLTDKVVRDGQVPAYSFVPPGIDNYDNAAKLDFIDRTMDERRTEAKQLLAEAGFGPGKPLTFEYLYMISIDSRRSVVAQAAMLKECNIILRLIGNEPKVHYDSVRAGDFTAAQARWGADFNDPQTFLFLLETRAGSYNYGGYSSATYDKLVDDGRFTLDLGKRAGILARAEQILLDDSAVVPLSFFSSKNLVAPYIKGFADNAADVNRTRWMRIEK